jgi:KaiC/GvpD/RAD55 family RecA-like ATPase
VGASVDPVQERGTWLRMQTRGAIEGYDGLSLVELKPGEALTDFDTDRWTSSVRELDDGMSGGFYGMTVVSGKAGGGKSILALASAIEAAEAGWTVMYFNTELDDRQMNNRLRRHGISNEAFDRFAVMRVGFGVMVEDMAEWLCSRLDDETKAVLVVVDSSTTFARLAGVRHEDKGTLTELARLVMWTATLRQRTQGVISFMLVSELNSQGVEYGREIQHLADVVLRVEKTDEADTVELNCIKGREGGEKDYGQFFRDWRRGRLEAKIIADIRASDADHRQRGTGSQGPDRLSLGPGRRLGAAHRVRRRGQRDAVSTVRRCRQGGHQAGPDRRPERDDRRRASHGRSGRHGAGAGRSPGGGSWGRR